MVVSIESLITPDILKPARYLGNELGAVHKPWEKAIVHWALTYPEIYEVGASNLGHIILYGILNDRPDQLCDRAYLPAIDLINKLRETNTPLFAVESRRSLKEFDILGFSLSYELGATNILEMLDLSHIPLTWKERQENTSQTYPLIFAGGQTATSNPEPYADFFDFIVLGDGEEVLVEIGEVIAQGKKAAIDRHQLLLNLTKVPGVYVPQFYDLQSNGTIKPNREDVPKQIVRRVATPIPKYSIGLVPYVETVHDRLVVEIRRGCTRGCRFCQPGMLTRPARDVEPQEVIETIEKGMRETGYNEFSLLSLSCSDYLALPAVGMEIKNRLRDDNITLSLPSQRVDRFDENIGNIIGGTRQGGLTFAPEAGTQRLRDIINKGLTNEELLRGVKTAWKQGWDKIKLYFMIGLPGETDEDVMGIVETIRWLRSECGHRQRKPLQFNITISNFTPKPHTPFQWHTVSTSEFLRKQEMLQSEFQKMRGVKVNMTDVRISAMEDFVGRGDRNIAPVIRRAWQLGAGMDAWWESVDRAYQAWEQAIDEGNLTWKYRQVQNGEWNVFDEDRSTADLATLPLPWDHLDTGIDKRWLKKDLEKALLAGTVPDCSFDGCSQCGVCGPDFGHNIVVPPLPIPEFSGQFTPNQNKAIRLRLRFGKQGDLRLISHLDLARLFDRSIRRASLPISYSGGFHPAPRIMIANALPLGATGSAEIVEFELTEMIDPEEFKQQLMAQLPPEIPIYGIEVIDSSSPMASQLISKAEYVLTISNQPDYDWDKWVDEINDRSEFIYQKKNKKGKVKEVNLREFLWQLDVKEITKDYAKIHYLGSCSGDGNTLRPDNLIMMFEEISQRELELLHIDRISLLLD